MTYLVWVANVLTLLGVFFFDKYRYLSFSDHREALDYQLWFIFYTDKSLRISCWHCRQPCQQLRCRWRSHSCGPTWHDRYCPLFLPSSVHGCQNLRKQGGGGGAAQKRLLEKSSINLNILTVFFGPLGSLKNDVLWWGKEMLEECFLFGNSPSTSQYTPPY